MRPRRRTTTQELRLAIGCLPRATRVAMLEGIETNDIIAGAYTDSGGICPMLAAHRAGGRTSCISFARAWDRFAFRDAGRRAAPRPATQRELLVLKSHLEASLLDDEAPHADLAAALADHRRLLARREAELQTAPVPRPRPGDPDRSHELRSRPGWAWTRVVRRYDDYRSTLARLTRGPQTGDPGHEPDTVERREPVSLS
jgi:hypothetical protein